MRVPPAKTKMQTTQKRIAIKKLMITTAIICSSIVVILTVLNALFQSDLSRAQMSEAVSLLDGAKRPFSEYFSDRHRWPDTAQQVLGNTSGKYTDSIAITSGAGAASGILTITATMKTTEVDSRIAGKTVQISTEDGFTWTCRAGNTNGVIKNSLPASCRP